MRTLDLLRNHPWNMQALISYYEGMDVLNKYVVKIEAIEGFSLDKTTYFENKDEAYAHAHMVVFGNLDGCTTNQRTLAKIRTLVKEAKAHC